MKVTYKWGIGGFSGYCDGAIFYYHPRIRQTLMREYPKMPHQPINDTYKNISRKLSKIKPSAGYKTNFKAYLAILRDENDEVKVACWYNIYIKMMWAMQAKYPQTVNLETITREQIEQENLPCRTVKMAVEDGLLAPVTGYEGFTAEI